MVATVTITMGSDGFYSCQVEESFQHFALFGYGETAQQAKDDLLESYAEISQMLKEEGKDVPELEFEWHYDMQAFFNYFDFDDLAFPNLKRDSSTSVVFASALLELSTLLSDN